ncbi:MAG: CDP-glucose 4,6-dehydratase [Salibacteraceae bacterium]
MNQQLSLQNAFNGKTVFLTGHTGFKGAWLTLLLHRLGAKVVGYSLAPKRNDDLYCTARIDELCTSIVDDVRNYSALKRAIEQSAPDIVIHMAAQALVLESYKQPVYTYDTNVMGTIHLLDGIRALTNPCAVLVVTTDKVYENLETHEPYSENDRLGGFDPYSNSKACAELATSSYRDSFFNSKTFDRHQKSVATARSGNVIGGGDWNENRLLPDVARALSANRDIVVRNPDSVRPWQHVLDPLVGYLTLVANMMNNPLGFNEAFNFGPDTEEEMTVKSLVETAIKAWGTGTFTVQTDDDAPHEAKLLKLSIEKAKKQLGWEPLLPATEAVKWTIDWYKNAIGSERNYTLAQIDGYLKLMGE